MYVKSLHIYPVKSGQGIDLTRSQVHARGLKDDRRFMIVDANGVFMTQRNTPKLAKLKAQVSGENLSLQLPNGKQVKIKAQENTTRRKVKVWRSAVDAAKVSQHTDGLLSQWLGKPVSLVFMDASAQRLASPDWTERPSPVSFADGYPLLITNTASLAALNALILAGDNPAVPMSRFRPNIVIDSDVPWGEDDWKQLKIGGVTLDLVKPCTRCIMTTLDQNSGEKQGREPLQSLRALRTSTDPRNEGVLFGVNAVPLGGGPVKVGDGVKIIPG